MTTDTAAVAYAKVVAGAGALVRDPVDTTLINQVTSLGTLGAVIANESVVGGQPAMTVVTRPAGFDTDGDGIPDTWETAHGLNPNNAADRNLTNPLGYTMVEQYINELGENHAAPTWNGDQCQLAHSGILDNGGYTHERRQRLRCGQRHRHQRPGHSHGEPWPSAFPCI